MFKHIAQQLPVSLAQTLDTSPECYETVLQAQAAGDHTRLPRGRECQYGQQREESGQLSTR
jgi:hypothetical protein